MVMKCVWYISGLACWLITALIAATVITERECAAEGWVYPGAIISVRGNSSAFSTVDSGMAAVKPADMSSERIAKGVVLLKERPRRNRTKAEQLQVYNRKNDPCNKAKVRRILKRIPGHKSCSPNTAVFASAVPNDPDYPLLYAPMTMDLPLCWDITQGSSNVVVLVIDTGVQYNHPDLVENIWVNPGETAANGIDDDGNGYIDDIHGINAITNAGDPADDNGHGTHVAGIIGARGNNGIGSTGVNWEVKIASAKFLASNGSGSISNAIKAIYYGNNIRLY
jgi:subtilisin family serine protease